MSNRLSLATLVVVAATVAGPIRPGPTSNPLEESKPPLPTLTLPEYVITRNCRKIQCCNLNFPKQGGSNGACLFSLSKVKAQVASHGYVSGSLENAVSQYGVLSVAITVVNSFYNYKYMPCIFMHDSK